VIRGSRRLCRVLLLLGASHLLGCGFIASTNVEYGTRIYGGVRYDFEDILPRSLPLSALCALLDFPFSFLADTLYLPVSVSEALRSNPEPDLSLIIIDGYVIEAENPEDPEVTGIPTAPLPSGLLPVSGAQIRAFVIVNGKSEPVSVGGTTKTEDRGYFSLQFKEAERWERIRIECAPYRTVEIPVSTLHGLTDWKYWKFNSLLIRMKKP